MGSEGGDGITKVILDLDNHEYVSRLREALGIAEKFTDSDKWKALVGVMKEVGIAAGIVATAYGAFKVALELTEEAEKLKQINKSFEMLAEGAGLATNSLKEHFVAAAKGLVDETDLLEAANKAILRMGANAKKIPEIMEIARKATVLFGGDLIENFNNLTLAMENGNQRMLRRYGLQVNVKKAEEDYAKTLGVGVKYLDDAAKKQAILNASLEVAEKKYKNVDETSLAATNAMTRIGVSFKEIKELGIELWGRIFGPPVQAAITKVAELVDGVATKLRAMFGDDKELSTLLAKQKVLKQNIEELQRQVPLLEKIGNVGMNPFSLYGMLFKDKILEKRKQELKEIEEQIDHMNKSTEKKEDPDKERKETEDRLKAMEQYKKDKEAFEKDLIAIKEARIKEEEKVETDAAMAEQHLLDQNAAIMEKANAEIIEKERKARELGLQNTEEFQQAKIDIYKKANMEIAANERSIDKARLQALKNNEEATKNSMKGVSAAFRTNAEQARQNFFNMSKLGNTAFNAIGKHATDAFKKIGRGSKDAGQLMKGFLFGAIADIAEAQGEAMLLMGLWPPNPVAIAGGGALIALAEVLRGAAGGESGSSGVGASGGGGGGYSASPDSSNQINEPATPEQIQKKAVTVQISGHYFETDQTRTRLMEMIRESGDFTDFNLKQIGS